MGTRFDLTSLVTTIIFLLVVAAVAYRSTTADERAKGAIIIRALIQRVLDYRRQELEPFRDALRTRTRWAIVAPAIVLTQIALVCARGDSSPATLLAWGASFGPRTTNGEWWRLATAAFVNSGTWSLIVYAAVVVQLGMMLERIVGSLAFATTYVIAGICAGLTAVWMQPMSVSAGASAAVFGLYGLLLASFVAGRLARSELTIPVAAIVRLAPVTIVFALYSLFADATTAASALAGLASGAALGAFIASDIAVRRPPPRRVGVVSVASVALVALCAVPLRGITDVNPEIQRLVDIEHRTNAAFEAGAKQFSRGKTTSDALIAVIERTIVPELQAADVRLAALDRVPPEDQPRLADARLYLRARCDSWKLRADSLRSVTTKPRSRTVETSEAFRAEAERQYRSSARVRGKAEAAERQAIEALDRISRQTKVALQ